MNKYGAMAQKHWRTYLPSRYSEISDPTSFFDQLGQEVSDRIASLQLDLAETARRTESEDYLARVGRLNMARLQAEGIVLPEMVLLPPENEETEEPLPEEWRIPSAQETVADTPD